MTKTRISTGLIHGDISISVPMTGFGGRQSPLIALIYMYEPRGLSPPLTGFLHRARRCAEGPEQDTQRQEKPNVKFGGLGS